VQLVVVYGAELADEVCVEFFGGLDDEEPDVVFGEGRVVVGCVLERLDCSAEFVFDGFDDGPGADFDFKGRFGTFGEDDFGEFGLF
jgi:hypothetical protein